MKVEINLYANLARYLPKDVRQGDRMVEVREGLTITQLLQELNIPSDQIKLVFLNGEHVDPDAVLKEGSRVGVFPPVGGG